MRIVVALGGNALLERGEQPDAAIQHRHIVRAARALAPLCREHQVIICHGNGPQVGMLALESEADAQLSTPYPLDVLVAQTQGMIGYWITQELGNAHVGKPVIALVTQTVVRADDPAFGAPTKFIGAIYHRVEAEQLARTHGWTVRADGAFFRRVVASPDPVGIVEIDTVRQLINSGSVVVTGGGGGAAVIGEKDGSYRGIEAIVDKDLTSELLARELDADLLLILTDVDAVMRDFGTAQATPISRLTVAELQAMAFPAGSMGPKVQACVRFVLQTGRAAAIGALVDAADIVAGHAGTTVVPATTGASSAGLVQLGTP